MHNFHCFSISALNERGVNGLLSHYFEEKLPAEAKNPPQYKRVMGMGSASAQKCDSKFETLTRTRTMLNSLKTPAEKAAVVSKVLSQGNASPPENNESCSCWMCVYSDEVLCNEEDELKPQTQATAMHYKNKGFYYASAINVETGKWNRVSTNFSLSYVNHITPTCLLDGVYPGINTSYLYFGLDHSFFPLHVEDLSMYSINVLHRTGYPKVWSVLESS